MKRLDEIDIAPRDRAAIEEAARLLRARFPVAQVILFGSKARGDDDVESDIDLLVLTGRPLTPAEESTVRDVLFPLQLKHDVVLSALVLPAMEWWDGLTSVLPIHREVDEQGVVA